MTTDSRKVQLGVEVDAAKAREGFQDVKDAARDMAQGVAQAGKEAAKGVDGIGAGTGATAQQVQQSARSIADSIKRVSAAADEAARASMTWNDFLKQGMGPLMKQFTTEGATTAEAHTRAMRQLSEEWRRYKAEMQSAATVQKQAATTAADGVDRMAASQSRFLESLKRQSVQLTEGRAALLEMRAAQLGVSQAADPYIQKIRAAERAQGDLGMSAKQTAAALRGVPAQFTDIFTSLASGQAPITVLLQQGGQLKDMFGGAGAAARALGGYVVGLINPFTLVAAAVGAVGLAYFQGSKEADSYTRALIMSGNAAGTTAGQLAGMAERIGDAVGTQGKAAEALAAMAGTGRVAASNLEYFSRVAVQMERTVGHAVSQTAAEFEELGKAPLAASEKLNEKYRYLTASVYEQIKALQDQGRAEEAAAAAQTAYAKAFDDRTKQVEANLGAIERGWLHVVDAAKAGWDAMLNVGRKATLSDQIADVSSQIASHNPLSIFGPSLDELKARQAALQELQRLQQRGAEITGEQQRLTQLSIAWQKEADQYKDKSAKRDQEILAAAIRGRELVNAGLLTEAALRERLAGIAEKYADKGKSPATTAAEEAKKLVAAGKELAEALLAQDVGLSGDFYKKWDSLSLAYKAGAIGAGELTKAQAELLSQQPAIAGMVKADEARAAAMAAVVEGEVRRANALRGNVAQMREELQTLGMSKQELAYYAAGKLDAAAAAEELAAANLNEAAATGEAAGASAEAVAHYRSLAEARLDAARALREQSGMTLEKAQKQATIDAADAAEKEWKRTAESIEQSLTDALMRGFESGEDFAENFRNTLKNMFATLVLRPIIQPIAQGMSGMVLQAMGMPAGASGGGGGGNLFSTAQNAYSLYNNGSIAAQYFGGTMSGANALGTMYANATGTGLDGLLATNGAYGTAAYSPGLGTFGAGLGGAMLAYNATGSYTAGVAGGAAGMAASGAIGGAMAGSGAMAGATAALSAIPVWGWAALAVLAIAGDLMKTEKNPRVSYQMAQRGGAADKSWEDGVKVSSVFGELGLNSNSKDVDAGDFRKQLEAMAAFDNAMAAFLSEREIEAVRARMDGWKSARVSAKYAAGGQRDRMLAIAEGIGGAVFADAQAFVDSGQAKGNKGVQAFTQFVLDRIRTDELSDLVGGLGATLSEDDAMTWMQSLNRTEKVRDEKGKLKKVEISGFNEIAAATQQLTAVLGQDAGKALAAQVNAMAGQFDALGLALPTSADGFRALVAGIDLTTQAGQQLWMQLGPLADGFGKVMGAQQQLYDMLVPESEKLAKAQTDLVKEFRDLNQAMPSSAAELRTLIDAQDQSTEAGRTMRAELLALVPAFNGVSGAAVEAGRAWESLRADLTKFRDEIMGGELAGLSPEAAYTAAQSQFDQTSRLAALGNQDALAALSDVGRSFLDASREYFASGASYFADLASVQGAVDAGLSLTDRKLAAIASGTQVPAFAEGGFHAGGLRLVGEDGPELEVTGPARYWTAEQTRGLFSPDSSRASSARDQEIIDELKVVVRVLSAGLSALDARLARLEGSSAEQARQARIGNDRRVA